MARRQDGDDDRRLHFLAIAWILAVAIGVVLPSAASARTWYVSSSGSDKAAGTVDQPFASIQRGVDAAAAGDTVSVGAGLYAVSAAVRIVGKRGSAEQPLALIGNGMPTIVGTDERVPGIWRGMIEIVDSSGVRLQGLAVQSSFFFGIKVERSDQIELVNNRSTISLASGIWVSDSTDIRVEGNDISRFCDRKQFGADGRTGCQEGISIANVDGFSVLRNRVHDALQQLDVKPGGGEGIDVKQGSRNGLVEGNEVWNLAQLGIYVDAYQRGVSNIKVHANRVWNARQGIVVSSERGGPGVGIDVSDNLVHDVGYHGIWVTDFNRGQGGDGPRRDVRIYNNTIVNAGIKEAKSPACRQQESSCADGGTGIRVDTANITGLAIHDNIVLDSRTAPMQINPAVQAESRIDRNLLWPVGKGQAPGEYVGGSAIIADPRLVDPAAGDYRLRPGSPAIGAGIGGSPSTRDLNGVERAPGAIDLGALAFTRR